MDGKLHWSGQPIVLYVNNNNEDLKNDIGPLNNSKTRRNVIRIFALKLYKWRVALFVIS